METTNENPETTGLYECLGCGNNECFTGVDSHGFGGFDSCENDLTDPCSEDEGGSRYCECETELEQDFDVPARERGVSAKDLEIEYHAHTGGSDGAEIGSYDSIKCRVCGATAWSA